jgi:hypothetical protein
MLTKVVGRWAILHRRGGFRALMETSMATFKRLHRTSGKNEEIDVNMDAVLHMQWFTDHTLIQFAEGVTLAVQETPNHIHQTNPLRHGGPHGDVIPA